MSVAVATRSVTRAASHARGPTAYRPSTCWRPARLELVAPGLAGWVLSPDHLGDPRRCVWRRAVRRCRVFLEHLQALTDVHRPRSVLGVLDPDLGQAVVHRPLQAVGGVPHLGLDDVEQAREVEAL